AHDNADHMTSAMGREELNQTVQLSVAVDLDLFLRSPALAPQIENESGKRSVFETVFETFRSLSVLPQRSTRLIVEVGIESHLCNRLVLGALVFGSRSVIVKDFVIAGNEITRKTLLELANGFTAPER